MRWWMLFCMLLVLGSAAEIGAPAELNVTDNITVPVNVYAGFPGTRVNAQWDNTKLHIFPGEYWLTSESQGLTFHLFMQPGLCGSTNLTFSLGEARASTRLNFGNCVPTYISLPQMTPLERNFYELKTKKIDVAEKYLQVTPDIQAKIDEIQWQIQEALAESDFIKKDLIATQAKSKITDLDRSFPHINDMGESIELIGTMNMTEKLEKQFGPIEPAPFLFYKRRVDTQVTAPGSVRNFTLYKLVFYNSAVDKNTTFLIVEDISPTVTDTKLYYNSTFAVWEVNLAPREIRTIRYGVYERVERPITTFTFRKQSAPQPQKPPEEPEQKPPEPEENVTLPAQPEHKPESLPLSKTQVSFVDNFLGIFKLVYKLLTGK